MRSPSFTGRWRAWRSRRTASARRRSWPAARSRPRPRSNRTTMPGRRPAARPCRSWSSGQAAVGVEPEHADETDPEPDPFHARRMLAAQRREDAHPQWRRCHRHRGHAELTLCSARLTMPLPSSISNTPSAAALRHCAGWACRHAAPARKANISPPATVKRMPPSRNGVNPPSSASGCRGRWIPRSGTPPPARGRRGARRIGRGCRWHCCSSAQATPGAWNAFENHAPSRKILREPFDPALDAFDHRLLALLQDDAAHPDRAGRSGRACRQRGAAADHPLPQDRPAGRWRCWIRRRSRPWC